MLPHEDLFADAETESVMLAEANSDPRLVLRISGNLVLKESRRHSSLTRICPRFQMFQAFPTVPSGQPSSQSTWAATAHFASCASWSLRKAKLAGVKLAATKAEAAYLNADVQDDKLTEEEGTPNHAHIKSLEQAPDLTRFRMEMFDFDEKTKPSGLQSMRGQARPEYNSMMYDQY